MFQTLPANSGQGGNAPLPLPQRIYPEAASITEKKLELFTPEKPSESPQYQVSWKAVAALVGGVVLLALGAAALAFFIASPISSGVALLLGLAFAGSTGILGGVLAAAGGVALQMNQFLSDRFVNSQSLQNVPQKRAWLHEAALERSAEAVQGETEMILKLKEDLLNTSDDEEFEARLDNLCLWLDFTVDTYGKAFRGKPKTTRQDVHEFRKLYQLAVAHPELQHICELKAKEAFFESIDTLDTNKKDNS